MRNRYESVLAALKAAAAVLLLASAVAPAEGAAQQVRIIADGTEIRLDPNASSPVITTLGAGTVLERVVVSGDWYGVVIAGDPGQDEFVGYVLATQVEAVGAAAQPAVPPPALAAPATGVGLGLRGIPTLEAQYEAERRRRSSGISKLVWGVVIAGGAQAALQLVPYWKVPAPEDYETADEYKGALDRRKAAENGAGVATGLGAALGAWGVAEVGFGWFNMRSLARELPRSSAPPLQEQYRDAVQMRSSGKRKIFWAVFLPVVAYGVTEWVPYFGVPEAADFDNVEDYESALDRRELAESARSWTYVVGGGLGAWGGTQWFFGARRMSQIEATARMTALSAPLAPSLSGVPVEVFANRRSGRTQLGIQLRW